jgi:hypothetical protein
VQEHFENSVQATVNRNVEGQWNNIKKCFLDTMSDCVVKVEKRARKQWKSVNNEEGRKNYRRLNNEMRRTKDKAKLE